MAATVDLFEKQKEWKQVAISAGNLSELYLTLGEVEQAVSSARQSVEFADRSGDGLQQRYQYSNLANALHNLGKIIEAETFFIKADKLEEKKQPDYPMLYGFEGFMFCDLLVSKFNINEVKKRGLYSLEKWAMPEKRLLDIALDKLSLGRAYLLEAAEKMDSTSKVESIFPIFQQAADYLNQAVAGLREAGVQDYIARGLFARAFYCRVQNQFPQAWDDLEEAREIAERGEMKLWLVDYHLEAARLVSYQ